MSGPRYCIAGCGGIALFLAFFWLLLLRLCGGCIVWSTIFVVIASVATLSFFLLFYGGWCFPGGAFCFIPLHAPSGSKAKTKYDDAKEEGTDTTRLKANYLTLYIVGGIFAIITIVLLLALCFMRRRIALAIAIVQEAARVSVFPCLGRAD